MVLLVPWQDIDLWPLCLTGSIRFWKNLAFICSSFLPKMRCLVCIILYKYVHVCVCERENGSKLVLRGANKKTLIWESLSQKKPTWWQEATLLKVPCCAKFTVSVSSTKQKWASLSIQSVDSLEMIKVQSFIYFVCSTWQEHGCGTLPELILLEVVNKGQNVLILRWHLNLDKTLMIIFPRVCITKQFVQIPGRRVKTIFFSVTI